MKDKTSYIDGASRTVRNVKIKDKKKIGGPSLKPALKALKKSLGQNITPKPGMKYKPVTRRGGK